MAEIYTNSYLINDLHFFTDDLEDWTPGRKYAVFINSGVFSQCKKVLEMHLLFDSRWDFQLHIGKQCYETKLIFLTIENEESFDFVQDMIYHAQYSFPWADQAVLYENTGSYHKLEEFTRVHNLKYNIEKIEDIESISNDGTIIRVITFAKCIDKIDLIRKYRLFKSRLQGDKPIYYYFVPAFPWYQQSLIDHFEIPIEHNQIDSVFPIILRHLYYSNMINIFDLIATKLAICDFRKPLQSNRLQEEIDTLIRLSLRKMTITETYIKNNVFDFVQYSMDWNFIPNNLCILYFVYTFQNYFDSVRILFRDRFLARPAFLKLSIMNITIKLTEQLDDLKKIPERTNMHFKIDGTDFNQMTFPLFMNIMEYDNVEEILLDTNFTWMSNDEGVANKAIYQFNAKTKITVKLFGSNSLNFIEEFVGFLKTFIYSNKLGLVINHSLDSYMIFDNLEISYLMFDQMHIDHKLLDELSRCNLKLKSIFINKCTLENSIENWELMIGLVKLRDVTIVEDDKTWQFMFDYISNCLIDSNLKEFRFNKMISIIDDTRNIDFDEIIFTMDEHNSKVMLKDLNSQRFVDLFDLKFRKEHESVDDYDFYQ